MASLTGSSPYDSLVSSLPAVEESVDTDVSVDPGLDTDVDVSTEESTDETSNDVEASDDQPTEEAVDPALADPAQQAEDAAWKAKSGNIPPALKELIAANPQYAKQLKNLYFTNQRLNSFGPAAEIKKMKEAIDGFGGVEKLTELQGQINAMGGEAGFQESIQELGAWRDIDTKWMNGDPALADHLAQANPASFEKIAPVMFGKLSDVNPDLYNCLGSQIIAQTLQSNGTIVNFQLMKQALAGGNGELAGQYLQRIEAALGGLIQMSQQAPKSRAADPQQKAWEQERQSYQEKEAQRFQQDVLTRNSAWMTPKVTSELAAYLNGGEKKLSPNTLQRINEAVKKEIWNNHLANNASFMKQKDALFAKADLDGVERLYKQYTDKLFSTVTRQIAKEFSLSPGAKRPAVTPVTGANGRARAQAEPGWTKTTKYPTPAEVDNNQTTYADKVADRFVLKDGRKIQVVSR